VTFPYGKARRVEGGLKARSTRGGIGETWWSQRFISVLESFALGTRLTRGRSYARQGQVLSLDITPGTVTSTVQGSRKTPYGVRIRLKPLREKAWLAVEKAIAAEAIHTAHLLAGEMPPDLEQVFTSVGAPLFPTSVGDLTMSCSCPDDAVPCKHIAATFYLLAEAFDDDPFQILLWRGREREALLAHLGSAGALFDQPLPSIFDDVHVPPLEELRDRFWVMPVPLPERPPVLETAPDLLLRQLPTPGAALGGRSLAAKLRPLYEAFASIQER
jgi:SWIM zinc finger